MNTLKGIPRVVSCSDSSLCRLPVIIQFSITQLFIGKAATAPFFFRKTHDIHSRSACIAPHKHTRHIVGNSGVYHFQAAA